MRPLLILLISFSLASCSSYSSDFSCTKRGGMGCMSLSMVNKAIDEKDIKNMEQEKNFFLPKTKRINIVFSEFTEGGRRSIIMDVNND